MVFSSITPTENMVTLEVWWYKDRIRTRELAMPELHLCQASLCPPRTGGMGAPERWDSTWQARHGSCPRGACTLRASAQNMVGMLCSTDVCMDSGGTGDTPLMSAMDSGRDGDAPLVMFVMDWGRDGDKVVLHSCQLSMLLHTAH